MCKKTVKQNVNVTDVIEQRGENQSDCRTADPPPSCRDATFPTFFLFHTFS